MMHLSRHFNTMEGLLVRAQDSSFRHYLQKHRSEFENLSEVEVRFFLFRLIVLCLRRAKLDLAEELFSLVPEDIKENDRYKSMWRMYKGLKAAEQNQCFHPSSVPPEKWWDGPHLFPDQKDGKELEQWYAGRVEFTEEDRIRVHAGEPPKTKNATPLSSYISVSREKFNEWCCDDHEFDDMEVGRFLEVVLYEDSETADIRVHPQVDVKFNVPALAFDPQRYLKRKGWA